MAENNSNLKQLLADAGVSFTVVDEFPTRGRRSPRQQTYSAILELARVRDGEIIAIDKLGDKNLRNLATALRDHAKKTGQKKDFVISERTQPGEQPVVYVKFNS